MLHVCMCACGYLEILAKALEGVCGYEAEDHDAHEGAHVVRQGRLNSEHVQDASREEPEDDHWYARNCNT
jgi:hypothetical protein